MKIIAIRKDTGVKLEVLHLRDAEGNTALKRLDKNGGVSFISTETLFSDYDLREAGDESGEVKNESLEFLVRKKFKFKVKGRDPVGRFEGVCEEYTVSAAREKMESTRGVLEWEFERNTEGRILTECGRSLIDPDRE